MTPSGDCSHMYFNIIVSWHLWFLIYIWDDSSLRQLYVCVPMWCFYMSYDVCFYMMLLIWMQICTWWNVIFLFFYIFKCYANANVNVWNADEYDNANNYLHDENIRCANMCCVQDVMQLWYLYICMKCLICGNASANYMKSKYFWCVIILSHVIAGYTYSRRTMEVNQERGMEDRRYEIERASCALSLLWQNRLWQSRYMFDPESHCTICMEIR